jgi:hypothetical protein
LVGRRPPRTAFCAFLVAGDRRPARDGIPELARVWQSERRMIHKKRLVMMGLGLGLGGGACATSAVVNNTDGPAAAIRAAEEVGATKVPAASLHLQLAKEQLARAQTMTGASDRTRAALLLERSQADAELALALTRNQAAQGGASQ